MANEVTPANNIKFEKFCGLLEKIHKRKRQRKDQDKILENFINDFKMSASQMIGIKNVSMFPFLRLLLPKFERTRSAYNLKETKLGALLVKVLSLPKQSRDAQKLLSFRSVSSSAENDFAGVAYFVVKSRLNAACDTFTIGDINRILDEISSAEAGNKATVLDEKFSFVVNKLSPDQLKWFLRIILKDLKLEMSHKRILAILHPDAPEYFENCSDLAKVCEEVCEGSARPVELGVQLFCAVSPMLSERLDVKHVAKLPIATYLIENKFDGERFQIHMENGVFEYFSRRGHKYSSNYGSTYESGLLTPHLKGCFKPGVTSFILDGEMMGWHKEGQYFGCKGMSFDIKKITDNSKYRPCFCAFDILYYNGRTLVGPPDKGGLTLASRLDVLDNMFTNVPGVIQHSERQAVHDRSDILAALNRAIEKQDEGIVVKDVASYYLPNKRNVGWYKIKPEYTEGATEDLDLVVVGADEAQDKRHGAARSLFLACLDRGQSDEPCRWVGVGRVASGLSWDQRHELGNKLQQHWRPYSTCPPPDTLVFHKEKPDFWILPEHSLVLTVRATELIRSADYGAGYTLRFPRVTRLRPDKPVGDVLTLTELHQLVASKGGAAVVKLSTTQIGESEVCADVKVTRKRRSVAPQVDERFRAPATQGAAPAAPAAPAAQGATGSLALQGRKVHIMSDDDDCNFKELAKIVESHAGKVVANIGSDTWVCIAGRMTRRVRDLVSSRTLDVASSAWLRALAPHGARVELRPLDLMSLAPATRLALARHYDRYGDTYTGTTDEDTLKRCFDKMDTEHEPIYLTTQEMLQLDKELFGDHNPLSFLRACHIHALRRDSIHATVARLYGATVYDAPSKDCTHTVAPRGTCSEEVDSVRKQCNTLLVSEDWLEACFAEKKLVPEHAYIL